MKTCVIVCAGEMGSPAAPIGADDLVIAADGGLRHVQALGLRPDVVLGDFDSLGYVPAEAERHPVEKDDTDAMLAVKRAMDMGYRQFVLYGSLDGPRVDHTMANFQVLHYLASRGCRGYLVGCRQIATVIRNGRVCFPAGWQGYLSVFCLGAQATGVTLQGVKYALDRATLSPDFPLGVSNQFTGAPAAVAVENGALLLIWDAANGIDVSRADEGQIS